jgi:hypothetical protein
MADPRDVDPLVQLLASPIASERADAHRRLGALLKEMVPTSCKCTQVLDDVGCPRTERTGELECDLSSLAPLVEARKSEDPEVRRRAEKILAVIRPYIAYKGMELCRMFEYLPECPSECPHHIPEGFVRIYCWLRDPTKWLPLEKTPGRCRIWWFCAASAWEDKPPPFPVFTQRHGTHCQLDVKRISCPGTFGDIRVCCTTCLGTKSKSIREAFLACENYMSMVGEDICGPKCDFVPFNERRWWGWDPRRKCANACIQNTYDCELRSKPKSGYEPLGPFGRVGDQRRSLAAGITATSGAWVEQEWLADWTMAARLDAVHHAEPDQYVEPDRLGHLSGSGLLTHNGNGADDTQVANLWEDTLDREAVWP